jgi:hypothetical protein
MINLGRVGGVSVVADIDQFHAAIWLDQDLKIMGRSLAILTIRIKKMQNSEGALRPREKKGAHLPFQEGGRTGGPCVRPGHTVVGLVLRARRPASGSSLEQVAGRRPPTGAA